MSEERFIEGYKTASRYIGLDIPKEEGYQYILKVNEAIKELEKSLENKEENNGPFDEDTSVLQGYLNKDDEEEDPKKILDDEDELERNLPHKELQAVTKEGHQGLGVSDSLSSDLLRDQARQAGISSATLSAILTLTPEIVKGIDYLIKNGDIDLDDIDKEGEKIAWASTQGFLAGYISSYLYATCVKGGFGEHLVDIDAISLGSVVVLSLDTIKSSILVALGKMSRTEMGEAFLNSVATSSLYVAGSHIGGAIGEALGLTLPGIGYLLGSLIGTSFCLAYNFTKKGLISLCIDTGFACFGLVDQDYQLPVKALKEMGIDVVGIDIAYLEEAELDEASLDMAELEETKLETVRFSFLKRGLIGVRKIGYMGDH